MKAACVNGAGEKKACKAEDLIKSMESDPDMKKHLEKLGKEKVHLLVTKHLTESVIPEGQNLDESHANRRAEDAILQKVQLALQNPNWNEPDLKQAIYNDPDMKTHVQFLGSTRVNDLIDQLIDKHI